jgi:hypothetical protein
LTIKRVILSIEVITVRRWLEFQRIPMPKDKYEDEIEEILQNADPDDEISSKNEEPATPQEPIELSESKEGKLVAWEEVPKELPEPRRRKSRSSRPGAPPIFTANRLIVGAVAFFVIGLAVRPILLYAFIAAVVLAASAYLLSQNEKKNQPGGGTSSRRTKYWRDAPIDFSDDDDDQDAPPNQWRGG